MEPVAALFEGMTSKMQPEKGKKAFFTAYVMFSVSASFSIFGIQFDVNQK